MKFWDYKIVKAATAELLEVAVTKLLSDDWEVKGGVCVTVEPPETLRSTGLTFYQAMRKIAT